MKRPESWFDIAALCGFTLILISLLMSLVQRSEGHYDLIAAIFAVWLIVSYLLLCLFCSLLTGEKLSQVKLETIPTGIVFTITCLSLLYAWL